jgi:hypothetical protein
MNRSVLVGLACCILSIAPPSAEADTLLGDIISGSYHFPCVNWQGAGGNTGDTIEIGFAVGGPISPPVSSVPIPNVGTGLPS